MHRANVGCGDCAMTGARWSDELGRLISAMCDGTIAADDARQLDALLTDDHEARRFYNNYMFLHAELFSQHVSLEAVEMTDEIGATLRLAGSPSTFRSEQSIRSAVRQTSSGGSRGRTITRRFAVAAALVGVAAVSSWATYAVTQSRLRGAQPIAQDSPAAPIDVARITATRNCLWAESAKNLGFGSRLTSGERLDLANGLVEITFNAGAVVVLEGPAQFDVDSPGRAQLH